MADPPLERTAPPAENAELLLLLQGGLGNQLLQLVLAESLAQDLGLRLVGSTVLMESRSRRLLGVTRRSVSPLVEQRLPLRPVPWHRHLAPRLAARLGIPAEDFLIPHVAGYLSVAKGQMEALEIFSRSSLRNATMLLVSPDFARSLARSLTPRQLARGLYHLARGKGLKALAFPTQLEVRKRLLRRRNRAAQCTVMGHALSPRDTVSAFLEADLLLFPSRIECSPLVLFEAAASRTPFLVTDVGNSAEIIRWTGGGRRLPGAASGDREGSVHADIEAGAALLDSLHADRADRAAMAAWAEATWRRHFTWSRIAAQCEELYQVLIDGRPIEGRFPAPAPTS